MSSLSHPDYDQDPRALLARITRNPHVLLMLDDQLLASRAFAQQAMLAHESAYEYLPQWHQDARLMALMVQRYPHNFPDAPAEVRTDPNIARAAVQADALNIQYVSANTPGYDELALVALHADPSCYEHLHPTIAHDLAFAQRALQVQPLVYGCLPKALQQNRTCAQRALELEATNVWAVMAHFAHDKELMLQGFTGYPKPSLLSRMDPQLLADPLFVLSCTHINAQSLGRACPTLRAQLDALVEQRETLNPLHALRAVCAQRQRQALEAQVPAARPRTVQAHAKAL